MQHHSGVALEIIMCLLVPLVQAVPRRNPTQ